MKNKRLIIILSVFASLVLIAILCSTLFTVKNVSLNWLTTRVIFQESDSQVAANVQRGESVFLVDKQSIVAKLESEYPYLKVVSVEIKFPNKLVIHTAERQELFSLKLRDNKHAIIDGDCKVLGFVTDSQLDAKLIKPIPITLTGYSVAEKDFELSQIANIGWIKTLLTNFNISLLSTGDEAVNIKSNITSLEIDVTGVKNVVNMTTRYGVKIRIENVPDDLNKKYISAFSIYYSLTPQQKSAGEIVVYSSMGQVKGEYRPTN